MKKHHNPNSQKRLRRRKTSNSSWSDLPSDLLNLVLERLSFANFQRAKSVCSSWYSASRQSVPKNHIPWLILFPQNNHENSCMLLNPEEKEKLYKTKDLGVEFSKSVCIATYGNWLFMKDPLCDLYIMNLFTREKIDLPSVESQPGMVSVERTMYGFHTSDNIVHRHTTRKDMYMGFPVFWIDEKTKDYIVLWKLYIFGGVVFAKKGVTSWKQIPEAKNCLHMVYKNHKLYFLSRFGDFKIFDFSGEIAQQTFQCGVKLESFHLGREPWSFVSKSLVVTVTGKVLEVERMWKSRSKTWSFLIHEIYSSRFLKKPKLIEYLGDESMLLDQGITVLLNEDTDGFIRNSIYFNGSREKDTNDTFIFNLETHKTELLYNFDRSSEQFSRAKWFLPSFKHTCC